jgi:hypothetical protein
MVILFVFLGLSGSLTFTERDSVLSNPMLSTNIQTIFEESEAVRNITKNLFQPVRSGRLFPQTLRNLAKKSQNTLNSHLYSLVFGGSIPSRRHLNAINPPYIVSVQVNLTSCGE